MLDRDGGNAYDLAFPDTAGLLQKLVHDERVSVALQQPTSAVECSWGWWLLMFPAHLGIQPVGPLARLPGWSSMLVCLRLGGVQSTCLIGPHFQSASGCKRLCSPGEVNEQLCTTSKALTPKSAFWLIIS